MSRCFRVLLGLELFPAKTAIGCFNGKQTRFEKDLLIRSMTTIERNDGTEANEQRAKRNDVKDFTR